MIRAEHISKWFGDVVAVSDVSFELGPGVTALLGPNGAGKSTVLRLLCGLATPSQGSLQVLGGDPRRDPSLYARIGLVPQQEGMFESLSPMEFTTLAARLTRTPDPEAAARRALGVVAVDPDARRPVRTMSKGNRQRVRIAAGIVHSPEVLFLDEPLTGLDPRQRLAVIELVHRLGTEGRCVLVSSHVLDEVERFGSRVLVIAQGRLAAEGDFRAIRELMDDRPHRLRVTTDAPARLAAGLLEASAVVGVDITGAESLEVQTVDVHTFRTAVAAVARDRGVHLFEVVPADDDLDSVFRYLVGR